MGTSSSYGGPTGRNPLLPDWAQPVGDGPAAPDSGQSPEGGPDQTGVDQALDGNQPGTPASNQPQAVPSVSFRGAKSSMTQYVNSGGGGGGIGRVARHYVGARGGAGRSAQAAVSGRASTGRLGSFLSGVASRGLETAAREIGLGNLEGRPAIAVFAEIANRLAPSGATLEEAAARRAVDDALYALYKKFDLGTADISSLNNMDADTIRDAVEASVSAYIYHRWLQELGDRIEENAITTDEAVRLEKEVRDYVEHTVRLDLRDVDVLRLNWEGPEGSRIVERIYREAYGLLES